MDKLSDSLQKPEEAALVAAERLRTATEPEAGGHKPHSYLWRGADAVSSLFVSRDSTRSEVNDYAVGFVKAVGLFARGRFGLASTFTAYALDAMNPETTAAMQLLDGTLGAAKGGLLRGAFHVLGQKEMPIATKGALLGVASNALETGLTRSTYVDPATGEFDLGAGLNRIRETSLNRTSLIANALIFTAAHGIFSAGDRIAGGAIKRTPFLANMTNGFSFGMVAGAGSEVMRAEAAGEELDAGRIAKKALLQGALDSVAAIPGGLQADAAFRTQTAESIKSAYYRTRWAISDGRVEAKRLTYVLLNSLNMRHPLQRIGDFVTGSHTAHAEPRAALTADNNPIAAFERELPKFSREIQAQEELMAEARDREHRYSIHDEMGRIRTSFATQLLALWHGTSERPGIVSYSDAELATSNTSAQRVAAIRRALTLTARADYPSVSPLTQALSDLLPSGMQAEFGKNHELVQELPKAKEQFFHFDARELTSRMAMPGALYHQKRAYSTPVDWLPFEATSQLPNFFHGTISHSLPSIFTERAIFPARELRLRGIAQTTGESAGQEFPRRAISITTDFDEAWAYTNHSPEYLTSYPVIVGISRNVIPKARPAGMLEPGELLVDKLGVGQSLLTRLGLTKPEVTHLFAPYSQVAALNRLLARHRVSGVQVVGLNEIKAPEWKRDE